MIESCTAPPSVAPIKIHSRPGINPNCAASTGPTRGPGPAIESGLTKDDWPTEPSAVYLGQGRILVIARTESSGVATTRAQFQMVSTDDGATWTRSKTNIGDVTASTPSLILDAQTGLLSNYYYQRGRGVLWRRVVAPDSVFDHPLHWPAPEAVAAGSRVTFDAGNVNATVIGGTHYLAFYSGQAPNTAILVSTVAAPAGVNADSQVQLRSRDVDW